jgi:hypothetical protein
MNQSRSWSTSIIIYVFVGVVGLLIGWLSYTLADTQGWAGAVEVFGVDLSLELLSIVFTIGVIDTLNRSRDRAETEAREHRRERQRELERITDRLVKSEHHEKEYLINQLRSNQFLTDGSMIGAYLQGLDLPKGRLFDAQLEEANLMSAVLPRANLERANLRNANLHKADLTDTRLAYADLRGAYLFRAKMDRAHMEGVKMDENTILPDGTRYGANVEPTQGNTR